MTALLQEEKNERKMLRGVIKVFIGNHATRVADGCYSSHKMQLLKSLVFASSFIETHGHSRDSMKLAYYIALCTFEITLSCESQ